METRKTRVTAMDALVIIFSFSRRLSLAAESSQLSKYRRELTAPG